MRAFFSCTLSGLIILYYGSITRFAHRLGHFYGRDGRFAAHIVLRRRKNTTSFKRLPKVRKRLVGIETEHAFPNPPELPAAAFQITLACGIFFVPIRPVPHITVTLDG